MDEIQNIKFEEKIGKSIESIYILKNIISFLSEKQKLKIIIYNKDLQKKFEYKAYNEEEGQEKGKGKEYYGNNELIYEGEYLNRKNMEKEKNIIEMVY